MRMGSPSAIGEHVRSTGVDSTLPANVPQNAPTGRQPLPRGLGGPHVPPCGAVVLAVPRRVPIFRLMPPKPIELPPAVARLVEDMRVFHAEPNATKQDEIAARQLHALKQH